MKLLFRILLPLLVVGGASWWAWHLIHTKPEPRTFASPPQVTKVEATRLRPQEFPVYLKTQGTVQPRTTTVLIPEVGGRITEISPHFREGGFFSEGDTLLQIDKLDYETALAVAESNEAQALTVLREEEVRGEQAVSNWRKLGRSGEPSDMVKRVPQLREARARHEAAVAEVAQARRNLERTTVRAPYNGRVLEQFVDVGQNISSNTQLARIFETDVMEVRLPLTNRQIAFVDLPEDLGERAPAPRVELRGRIGHRESTWTGRVVRTDSAIDEMSRQLFVVAEIDDPYRRLPGTAGGTPPLKIGMYLDGLVEGVVLEDVFVLPRSAVRVGGEVIVIEEDNRIRRQKIEPLWSNRDEVVVPSGEGGLGPGEVICLTPLAYPANGAPVLPTIDGVAPEVEQPGRGQGMVRRDGDRKLPAEVDGEQEEEKSQPEEKLETTEKS